MGDLASVICHQALTKTSDGLSYQMLHCKLLLVYNDCACVFNYQRFFVKLLNAWENFHRTFHGCARKEQVSGKFKARYNPFDKRCLVNWVGDWSCTPQNSTNLAVHNRIVYHSTLFLQKDNLSLNPCYADGGLVTF